MIEEYQTSHFPDTQSNTIKIKPTKNNCVGQHNPTPSGNAVQTDNLDKAIMAISELL